jgi:hypothetical protein
MSANVNYLMVSHTVVPERQEYCMTLSTTVMIDLTSGRKKYQAVGYVPVVMAKAFPIGLTLFWWS